MPCFCKHISLARITPTAPLAVRTVPPQLKHLFDLLQLEQLGERRGEQLSDALPSGGPRWIKEALSAQAPGVTLPDHFPPAGGMMMIAMLRLAEAAPLFPLQNPRRLLAVLTQASASLEANLAPQMRALAALRSPGLERMAAAARLTLALRAKGVCPTTLTGIDVLTEYAESATRVKAAKRLARDVSETRIQPFTLPEPQLSLAQKLAGLASYTRAAISSGLPPLSDPAFIGALRAQVEMLADMPAPKLKISPEEIAVVADLDVILEAFGEDALSPEGVERVNALLNAIAKMKVGLQAEAAALSAHLMMTPALPHVLKGLEVVQTSGVAIAASAAVSAPRPFGDLPILQLMERIATLSSVLERILGKPALWSCNACLFPVDDIAASLVDVAVPSVPPELAT